jgi:hypothetical protein
MKFSPILLTIATIGFMSTPAMARPAGQPFICAVESNDVNIRDAQTMRTVGKLNKGECLRPYKWYPGKNSFMMRTIDAEAYFMVVGSTGRVRMVPARFVAVVYK